jgi:hypothetical protein
MDVPTGVMIYGITSVGIREEWNQIPETLN